jgi:heterodisulfide reductase subunit D
MVLEDIKKIVYKCVKCGHCRVAYRQSLPICPAGEEFSFDSYYALGKMEITRSLLEGFLDWSYKISERFYRCTECGMCDKLCYRVIGNRPLDLYNEMRRELVRRGLGPLEEHKPLIDSIKNYDNPWLQPRSRRDRWTKNLGLKRFNNGMEFLLFVGCTSSYDPEVNVIARSAVEILKKGKVDFGILGNDEKCCGSTLYRLGILDEFERLRSSNIEIFNKLRIRKIITICAGCYETLKNEYNSKEYEVVHITDVVLDLIKTGKIRLDNKTDGIITYHDPCHLGRYSELYDSPRELINCIPDIKFVEMERNRESAWCCGAGGGVKTAIPKMAIDTGIKRIEEALNSGASKLVTSCPFCLQNLKIASEESNINIEVMDINDIINLSIRS